MAIEIIEKESSYQIVRTAYVAFNELGPGFPECFYEEAMVLELPDQGHQVERQKQVTVYFEGKKIGVHVLDTVVDGRVILEFKATPEILPMHRQQALSYLKAAGLQLASIIDFGASRLQVERVVWTRPRESSRG